MLFNHEFIYIQSHSNHFCPPAMPSQLPPSTLRLNKRPPQPSILLRSFESTVNNNGFAIFRTLIRRFIRLPKHLRLHARRLIGRNSGFAHGKEGSNVRHVGVVPHEQTVLVAFVEVWRVIPDVDAYVAIICGIL